MWHSIIVFYIKKSRCYSSLNPILQGNNNFYHDLYSTASVFITKLCLWKTQLTSGVTTHFPSLSNHQDNVSIATYNRLIGNLIPKFESRIDVINSFLPLMKRFATSMTIEAATASVNFQLGLIDLQSDVELKNAFKSKSLLILESGSGRKLF